MILDISGSAMTLNKVFKWLDQMGYAPRWSSTGVDVDLPRIEDVDDLRATIDMIFTDVSFELIPIS